MDEVMNFDARLEWLLEPFLLNFECFAEQDVEGLLNNLQDWELSFKEKDKKLRADTFGQGKMVSRLPKIHCYNFLV